MDISDFRTIIALVEKGSISEAAQSLGRVPSAITTRLQNIESELGNTLFIKENRRFIPTSTCKVLYENALQIVRLVSSAEQQATHALPGGTLRLGALDSMAATRLPTPLTLLYKRHREIAIELVTGISSTLYRSILDYELDAAFIADAPHDERLERFPAFDEKLVIVTASGYHSIASPLDLIEETLLVFQDGCSYRDRLTSWFRHHQVNPHRIAVMSSYHAILGGVSGGMGIGVIPESLFDTFHISGCVDIHPFETAFSQITTELIWRKENSTANTRALIDVLKEQPR
ncbi:LysR family transcriptional regulator [Lelliottia sp. RWM.1]|uniref:LysR family transcriptional regulator n=1 Tax=Lelliottia sp. RWM.1 TaxID=2663242 RepID=UPI00193CFFC3|nr:LysR family transcriptional regulator [Lelliottia sp. RWM.1]MBM3070868.1 LysR family transcriptional regulator [Lelliottia sp. RWM.1]